MITSVGIFVGGAEHFDKEDAEEEGPRVLDLYAGSGALGLEALSRGAREVVLVESGRPAIAAIRENVRALGVEAKIRLFSMAVEKALPELAAEQKPFDLIVADPPYAEVDKRTFTEILEGAARLLSPSGIFVLEHSSKSEEPAPPTGLMVWRRRAYGDTTLSLFRYS